MRRRSVLATGAPRVRTFVPRTPVPPMRARASGIGGVSTFVLRALLEDARIVLVGDERVVAVVAEELVGAGAAGDQVVSEAAADGVVPVGPAHDVVVVAAVHE